MANDVEVTFGGKIDDLINAVNQSKSAIQGIQSSVNGLASGFNSLKSTVAGAFAAMVGGGAFATVISNAIEATSEVNKLSKQFGITAEAASLMRVELGLVGISTDDYSQTITRMARMVKTQEDEMHRAGMATRDMNGHLLDQKTLVDNALKTLLSYKEGIDRNIVSFDLFGRNAAEATRLLKLNQDTHAAAEKAVRELGLAVDKDGIAAMRAYKQSTAEVGFVLDAFQKVIADALLPRMTDFNRLVRDQAPAALAAFRDIVNEINPLLDQLSAFIKAVYVKLRELGGQMDSTGSFFNDLKNTIRDTNEYLAKATFWVNAFGLAVKFIKGDEWKGLKEQLDAIYEIYLKAKATGGTDLAGLLGAKELDAAILKSWQSFLDMQKEIIVVGEQTIDRTKRSADAMTSAAKTAREIKVGELALERQLGQEMLTRTKIVLDQRVELMQMTEQQGLAAYMRASDQKYQADVALLEKQKAIMAGYPLEVAKINNEIKLLQAKHGTEMVRLNTEAVSKMIATLSEWTDAIQQSFNSSLRGMLAGTTSLKEAFTKMLGDMLVFFIEFVEKMIVKWAVGQAAQLLATQTTEGAKAATQVAGAASAEAGTLPIRIAKFTSDITADAAATFAGVFANLAPVLGPFAAGPAAASEAVVLGQLAAVPKFEKGSWAVPETTMALVHQGEMIIPAGMSAAIRGLATGGAGASGGGQIALSVHAWDAASVSTWLRRGGAAQIGKEIASHWNTNPTARPRY